MATNTDASLSGDDESQDLGSTTMPLDCSSSSSSISLSSPEYLLARLKSPPPSSLSRKRKVANNPPPNKGKDKQSKLTDPKSVMPVDHVRGMFNCARQQVVLCCL